MSLFIDLTGKRFGAWVVLRQDGRHKNGKILWLCQCNCGKTRLVLGSNLRHGNSTNCGCAKKVSQLAAVTTHGMTKTHTYKCWVGMHQRCSNPNSDSYSYYGGRGIKVCKRWSEFENFLSDMGQSPGRGFSVERKNPNLNYSPSNCVWLHKHDQGRNTSRVHRVTLEGVTRTAPEWSRLLDIPIHRIRQRIHRGLPPELILYVGPKRLPKTANKSSL